MSAPNADAAFDDAAIARAPVQERYETEMLSVARVRSDGDFDLLPYYEGRRDALRQLLEPEVPDGA